LARGVPMLSPEFMKLKGVLLIRNTIGTALLGLVCVLAVAAPVAATSVGLVVTDPGTLTLLGAALIGMGVWMRRSFFSRQSDREERR